MLHALTEHASNVHGTAAVSAQKGMRKHEGSEHFLIPDETRHFAKCITSVHNHHNSPEVITFIPIIQMRKLRRSCSIRGPQGRLGAESPPTPGLRVLLLASTDSGSRKFTTHSLSKKHVS